jgi:hypothetical protein
MSLAASLISILRVRRREVVGVGEGGEGGNNGKGERLRGVAERVRWSFCLIDRVNFTPPLGFLQGKKGLFLGFIWVFGNEAKNGGETKSWVGEG